jgi:hypothetical protein
LGALGQCLAI